MCIVLLFYFLWTYRQRYEKNDHPDAAANDASSSQSADQIPPMPNAN